MYRGGVQAKTVEFKTSSRGPVQSGLPPGLRFIGQRVFGLGDYWAWSKPSDAMVKRVMQQ